MLSPLAYLTVDGFPLRANSVAIAKSPQSLVFSCCLYSMNYNVSISVLVCTSLAMAFSTADLRFPGCDALSYMLQRLNLLLVLRMYTSEHHCRLSLCS